MFRAVAWAPYLDDRVEEADHPRDAELDWLRRRDDLACHWVLDRAAAEGARPVLRVVAHADHYRDPDNPFSPVARAGTVVTQSSGHADGPTLVPWANARSAADGMVGARGSSILLHEGPSLPLRGWAMQLGALNLRTLCPEPDTRSPEQVRSIENLATLLYGGRTTPGRKAAAALPALVESGLSWAVVVGSLLAIAPRRFDLESLEQVLRPVWYDATHDRRQPSGLA